MASERPTVSESEKTLVEDLEAAVVNGCSCPTSARLRRAAAARIREQDLANAKLREFANRIISEMQTEVEDVQEIAEDCGLLEPVEATEPCDPEQCVCAEYGFPSTCFRRTALLAHTESEDRNGER